jgi:3-methylcrotonyl-CoA carboxylase alpha subunit
MIAKLIARGDNRQEALQDLAGTLDSAKIWPIKTNAGFLSKALRHPDFESGKLDTDFIERNLAALVPSANPDEWLWEVAGVVAAWDTRDDPLSGFRLNAPRRRHVALGQAGEFREIDLPKSEADLTTIILDGPFFLGQSGDGEVGMASGITNGDHVLVFAEGQTHQFELAVRGSAAGHGVHDGEIEAPMPGRVTAVEISVGEKVAKGQRLLTLEAMKMEHAMTAPFDGTVAELNARPGAQVSEGQLLVKVEPEAVSEAALNAP